MTSDKKLLTQDICEEKNSNEELEKLKGVLQQRDNEISILCGETSIIWVGDDLTYNHFSLCERGCTVLKEIFNSQLLCDRTSALHQILFPFLPKSKSWIQAPLSFRMVQPLTQYCGSAPPKRYSSSKLN